jgi:NAD(P)-dependent dehydrogenase (short-subunit alcohol dehydrogenase family)
MKELKGRTAVVTGAASGMGLAMASRFAAEGMQVVMSDVEGGALQKAAASVEAAARASGGKVLAVTCDVADERSVTELAQRAIAAFGKVHVLCNNAGVVRQGSAWDQSMDDWKWVMGVNLWGVINGLRAFVPGMLAHGEEGHIVTTSSAAGLVASSSGSYTATKFAVVGMSEGLATEMANLSGGRIGVSVLCPGGVKSRIFESERNRPAALSEKGYIAPAVEAALSRLAAPDRTDQVSPEFIADLVVDAIRAQQFYILPMQAHFKKSINERLDALSKAVEAGPRTDA